MLTRKKIFLLTAGAALLARVFFAFCFHGSFFDFYHLVPGLDMQTLLRFSEWGGGADHPPFFTLHRLLIYLDWLFGGGNHHVWVIFVIQTLLGILAAVCISDLVLKFSRARRAALICGIISGCYMPFLVYEFSILQESFMVYFALFAFWSSFHALRKRFDRGSVILFCGAFFAALAGRPTALFMCGTLYLFCAYKLFKRRMLKKLLTPTAVLLVLFLACSLFNYSGYRRFSPFYTVLPYTLQFNAEQSAAKAAADTPPPRGSLIQSGLNAAKRVPTLFKYGELPENHNIYFWCEKIPLLNILPAPGAVIPLAAAGIMILIFSGAWKKRYGLLLLPLLMMALPLCARDPIGRYRLMLVPYFFIIAACAVTVFMKLKKPKIRGMALIGAGIGALFSIHNGDVPQRIRPFDYSAYAMAMEYSGKCSDPDEFLNEYLRYWQQAPASEQAFCLLMDKLITHRKIEYAISVTATSECSEQNPDLIHFYRALCYAQKGIPADTEFHLRKIRNPRSLPYHAYKNAFMLRDWAAQALKKSVR